MCASCYNAHLLKTNKKYKQNCVEFAKNYRRTAEGKRRIKNNTLKRRYGIDLAKYEQMAAQQNFKCKLCNKQKRLVVEHSHATGAVRGLTCDKCNNIIGVVENNMQDFYKYIFYILTHGQVNPAITLKDFFINPAWSGKLSEESKG